MGEAETARLVQRSKSGAVGSGTGVGVVTGGGTDSGRVSVS
jgi:hypothetical protein